MSNHMRKQFVALQRQSEQTRSALDQLQGNLKHLEEELAAFLEAYYHAVGAEFETLSALKQSLHEVAFEATSGRPHRAISESEAPDVLAKTSGQASFKQFYHAMARECHPDVAATQTELAQMKTEMMKTLNQAYARKSLSEMWQVKWELEQHKANGKLTHKQRLELLKAQQAQMQSALQEMERREQELRESSAFQLMQHANLMRLCGQDFVETVRQRVLSQIEETKRQLVSARIKSRYWQHVRTASAAPSCRGTL